MYRMLRTTILITFGLLVIGIISGCGDDSPEEVTDPSSPTTSEATPPRTDGLYDVPPPNTALPFTIDLLPGAEIPPNTQFSLIFDNPGVAVAAVTVNGVAATGSGTNWTVSLTLPEGDGQALNVSWIYPDGRSGSQAVGPYTVRVPDTTPPRITGGTVTDGTVNVDPAPLNAGGFQFGFHEAITGSIKLTDEAGVDLNWIANVAGQTATLTAVAGQELVNETTYKVEIDVHDGASNPLQVTITFVTKPK